MNHQVFSLLWCQEQEYDQLRIETLQDLEVYNSAFVAMKKEPYAVEDAVKSWAPVKFWDAILARGEVHIIRDDRPLALFMITNLVPGLHACLEFFVPAARRNPGDMNKILEAVDNVLEYCFDPHKLALMKIKAVSHPKNNGINHFLDRFGFKSLTSLAYETSFDGEPQTMILWELHNPLLGINAIPVESTGAQANNDWDEPNRVDSGNDSTDARGGNTGPTYYETVREPWDVLVSVTDSQRSMASTANRQPANAVGGSSRRAAPAGIANNW